MHETTIPDAVRARIAARRGRFEIFDRLDPARTALLVIDMQKAFIDPGAPVEVPMARGIIPNVNRLARAARSSSIPVFWVAMTAWRRGGVTSWPVFYNHFGSAEFGERHLAALTAGSPLHAFADDLDIAPGEQLVEKLRFSAFIQGSSELDAMLRARGIDTIVIAGTLTNRCCESTARDAMMIGYKVLLVEDANAALSDQEHVAALVNVATAFGDVRRTGEVIEMLEAR